MKIKGRFLDSDEITMFTFMICGASAFGHMVIHCVLLLLHDVAFRTGEVVAGGITRFADAGDFLECTWGTSFLGVARQAVTDVF